jgi:hypothetical protein
MQFLLPSDAARVPGAHIRARSVSEGKPDSLAYASGSDAGARMFCHTPAFVLRSAAELLLVQFPERVYLWPDGVLIHHAW